MSLFKKAFDYFTSDGSKPLPPKVGRNEPCWCGSGLKYKRCHWDKDEKVRYEACASKCAGAS